MAPFPCSCLFREQEITSYNKAISNYILSVAASHLGGVVIFPGSLSLSRLKLVIFIQAQTDLLSKSSGRISGELEGD